jgi:hypothetical protein
LKQSQNDENKPKPKESKKMSWLSVCQKVVDEKSYKYINENTYEELTSPNKKGTIIIDVVTANMLLKVVNALSEKNRLNFLSFPLLKAVNVGWKLIESVSNEKQQGK